MYSLKEDTEHLTLLQEFTLCRLITRCRMRSPSLSGCGLRYLLPVLKLSLPRLRLDLQFTVKWKLAKIHGSWVPGSQPFQAKTSDRKSWKWKTIFWTRTAHMRLQVVCEICFLRTNGRCMKLEHWQLESPDQATVTGETLRHFGWGEARAHGTA